MFKTSYEYYKIALPLLICVLSFCFLRPVSVRGETFIHKNHQFIACSCVPEWKRRNREMDWLEFPASFTTFLIWQVFRKKGEALEISPGREAFRAYWLIFKLSNVVPQMFRRHPQIFFKLTISEWTWLWKDINSGKLD